jgi:hypothetical protein
MHLTFAMENRMLDKIAKPFNVELPEAAGLDELLGKVLPVVRKYSEDLRETEYYLDKHWIEVRDEEDFHEVILHIFGEGGEYIRSVDGEINSGDWRYLGNKLVFGPGGSEGQVYELVFLDDDFFILQKHGNYRKFRRRYLVLVREPLAKNLEWHQLVEYLFDRYRNSNSFFITVVILLLLIVTLVLLLS